MNLPNPSLTNLGKKIAFSSMVQYGGKLLQVVLGTICLKLIARFLTTHDYASYAAITEYALFFSVAANLGIFAHVVKRIADNPKDAQFFLHALVLRVGSALVFFLLAIVYLCIVGYSQFFILGTALFLSALLADFVTSVCDAFLQANYHMGRATLALVSGKLLYTAMLIAVIRLQHLFAPASSVMVVLAMTIASSLLTAILSVYFVRQQIRWRWVIDWRQLWPVLRVSLPFGLITIVNALYFRFLPDYFAHYFLSATGFAAFSIAFRIAQVVSLVSTFLLFSALPGFRQYLDAGHWQKAMALYTKLSKVLLGAGVLLVLGGTLTAEFMVGFLADKKYIITEFWFMLPLMLLLAAISYGYDLVLITLFALNQEKWFLKRELRALLIAVVLLIPTFFFMGDSVRLVMILLSAIVAELYMVVIGYKKVQKLFAQKM